MYSLPSLPSLRPSLPPSLPPSLLPSLPPSHHSYSLVTGPPNVTAIPETNINSTSASLTWDPPKDLNGEITGYSVQLVVNATDVSSSLGRRKRRQTGSDIRVECVIDGVDRTIAVPGNATSVTVSLSEECSLYLCNSTSPTV